MENIRKDKIQLGVDWLPLIINGCPVEIYFPSAFTQKEFTETDAGAVEQALLATYKKPSAEAKFQ